MTKSTHTFASILLGVVFVAILAGASGPFVLGADEAKREVSGRSLPALTSSLKTNLDYCQQWLDGQDFKTLTQTAAGLSIVAEALARKSDEATAKACQEILLSSKGLETAARSKDAPLSTTEIAKLRTKIAELKPAAANPGTPLAKPKAGSVRTMMDLLEGTLGDAKTGAAVGDLPSAKINAQVLAELGEVMSNYKTDARWKGWNDDFIARSQAVAASDSSDPATIKQLLKEVSLSCERCHKKK